MLIPNSIYINKDKLPDNVTNMADTFYGCTNLIEFDEGLPDSVINMVLPQIM